MAIFLIEELWIEPLEDINAHGWEIKGHVRSEEKAIRYATKDMYRIEDARWPLEHIAEFEYGFPEEVTHVPRYRYRKLERL